MLEDAYKSCPDVICIRAGISVQLSVVANVYFNGLLCNPCCADLSGLICMFSAMPAHCFWRYYFSPIAVELVTGEEQKNVTPVGAQAVFWQSRVRSWWALGGSRAETKSSAWPPRDVLGVYFTVAIATNRRVGLSNIFGSLVKS